MLEKVLKSALGNPWKIAAAPSIGDLVVVDARIDGGPMFKRIRPRARGTWRLACCVGWPT